MSSPADLDAFMANMLNDVGAAMSGALVLIGDKLGLYKALAAAGPLTSEELAEQTGTAERYVREWLAAQAAAGYVTYHPADRRYSMGVVKNDGVGRRRGAGLYAGPLRGHGLAFQG